jgi:hypothetical protein
MTKLVKKKDKYYSLVNELNETLSSTFCGRVPMTVVNQPVFMHSSKVNTLMGFYSNIKGKGYGKELLQKVIDAERKLGTRYLTLGVSKNNQAAINLYEGCGFKIKGDCAGNEKYHFMYLDLSFERISIGDDNFWSWKTEDEGPPYNKKEVRVLKNGVLHYHKLLRDDYTGDYTNYAVTPELIARFLNIYSSKLENISASRV